VREGVQLVVAIRGQDCLAELTRAYLRSRLMGSETNERRQRLVITKVSRDIIEQNCRVRLQLPMREFLRSLKMPQCEEGSYFV
jgi:hypothetical protein